MDGMISAALEKTILETIVQPTIRGLSVDGLRYRGFLYFGLMLTPDDGPKVLEFNCRMGDPETQAIVMRMDFDLAEACLRAASSKLSGFNLRWHPGASACVVLASGGYPESYQQEKKVAKVGNEAAIFHAGTRREGNDYYTSGGRVLGVSARAAELNSALRMCYDICGIVGFDGAFFRSDIGHRALSRSAKGAS
jgi:phosphoribosylamine--glycine ligase